MLMSDNDDQAQADTVEEEIETFVSTEETGVEPIDDNAFQDQEPEEAHEEEPEEVEEEPTATPEPPKNYRVKPQSDVDRTALQLKKANPTWDLETCVSKAKLVHGDSATPVKEETLADVEKEIADLRAKRATAIREFDAEKQVELEEQMDVLRDKKLSLTHKKSETQQNEQAQFEQETERYTSQAHELYPDATNNASALYKRMVEIDKSMHDSENPLLYSSDKILKLAQMAANSLGIAPKAKSVTPVQVKKQRPVISPSSGSSRTSQAASPVTKALNSDMSEHEYESLVGSLLT